MNSFLKRQFRAQTNKEEIAKIVVEELKSAPPNQDSEGPSDDWLNKFERYAEDASSDDLRLMFAKLLAGEIRNLSDTDIQEAVSTRLLVYAAKLIVKGFNSYDACIHTIVQSLSDEDDVIEVLEKLIKLHFKEL